MSGHANFHTITGYTTLHLQPGPQVDDGMNVAGNRQVGGVAYSEVGVGPQEEPQNAQVDAQAESSKALVRQLDILLARAAASATQSVDATAVKAALGELDIPADKRKALAAAADKAQRAFLAINDFTGRQIAASVSATDGKFDWNEQNAAGKAVKAAELAALRATIADELANPATDIQNWDANGVTARANERVESFVRDKVAFLAEVLELPVPADVRGALVVDTLENRTYADREIAAAAGRILDRDEVRAAFELARNALTAAKVAQLSDPDVFLAFETVGARLDAAIEAELTAEKRAEMGDAGHAVLRNLLSAGFADFCGDGLVGAVARLVADGRIDALDAHAANEANARPGVATGRRLLADARAAFRDDWLPAPLAEAIRTGAATAVQKAIAEALQKRAYDLVARLGAGLDPAKAARFKAFAITLDYRDQALAATEEALQAAAEALRAAPDVDQAEPKLAEIAGVPFSPRNAAAFVADAATWMGVQLDGPRIERAVGLLAEFAAGIPARNATLLARFIVSLDLTDRSLDLDRRRVETIAPQIAGWRDFKFGDPGKEQIAAVFLDEANALIRDYEKPADKAREYVNDISGSMSRDIGRGIYTIGGTRFVRRPPAEVLAEFNRLVTTPKARRALSILMSQASALPVLSHQMKVPMPPNDIRPQAVDTSALPGAGQFVSRGMDPELFLSNQVAGDITSIYALSVSADGKTALLNIAKSAKLLVGTTESKMHTHFGTMIVEEQLTIDLTAEIPTVTDVRVAQRISDQRDLEERYLEETARIPQPPPSPAAVPQM